MLVAYHITTALLSLLLVCVIIYESFYGKDVDDGVLKLRRRSFHVIFGFYLLATVARYSSVSPKGVELFPMMALCLDVITFVTFSILASGYFGRWYYKSIYNWLFGLLLPVMLLVFIIVMHFTSHYQPVYSYQELASQFSSPETRILHIGRCTIVVLLSFLYIFYLGVFYNARQYDNKKNRPRLTFLEKKQKHSEHRNVFIYMLVLSLTMVSNYTGSLAYYTFCNVAMIALVSSSVVVFSRFVNQMRMKQKGTFYPVAIEHELKRIESQIKDTPFFDGNPSLEEVAEKLNVSRDELSDYIYQTRQMSFSQWLSICKLKFVARLLETTDDSIADVSASAGYKNIPSMYRAFKSVYGMTPTEYRSKKRNNSQAGSM